MSGHRDSWRDTFGAVGEALAEVVRAEIAVVAEAWKTSGREAGKVLGLAVVIGYLCLVCIPSLFVFALLMGLHTGLGWPLWAAALAVATLTGGVAFVLFRVAVNVMTHRFESPMATLRQRLADNRTWWSERILSEGVSEGEQDAAVDAGD